MMMLVASILAATPPSDAALELIRLRVAGAFAEPEVVEDVAEAHFGESSLKMWSVQEDGVWTRVVEIIPKKRPKGLAGYLRHWRASHGCTAEESRDLPPSKRSGSPPPPQVTFRGSCEGGDAYILRVLLIGDVVYELHVDRRGLDAPLRRAMLRLLARVELKAP